MTTEIRNWAVVAAAMEANGATNSEMYRRAKALAQGQADPMPTSDPAAPFSITTVWLIRLIDEAPIRPGNSNYFHCYD